MLVSRSSLGLQLAGGGCWGEEDMEADADLPMVTAKRPRLNACRRIPQAESRNAAEYVMQLQTGGKRKATCLECHTQFAEGEVRICRRSDLKTGGRWCHTHCLPGGLRVDDTLVASGEESAEMTSLLHRQECRNRSLEQVSAETEAPDLQVIRTGLQQMTMGSSLEEPSGQSQDARRVEAGDDEVAESIWMAALKAPAVAIMDLTPNFHEAYRNVKTWLLREVLSRNDASEEGRQAWWRLLMVEKLLFHKGGEAGESLNSKLRSRLQAVDDGDWLCLLAELLESNEHAPPARRVTSDANVAERVLRLAKQESWRRAISALKPAGAPDRSLMAWEKLQRELPDTDSRCSAGDGPIELTEEERVDLRNGILRRIRQADGAASSGLLGSGANMWKLLVRDDDDELTVLVLDLF